MVYVRSLFFCLHMIGVEQNYRGVILSFCGLCVIFACVDC